MLLKWSNRAIVLLLICLLQITLSKTQSYKKEGCLEYSDLCDKNEFCHDNGLTGICIEDAELNNDENLKQNSNDNILTKLNEPDELDEQDDIKEKVNLEDCISKSILKYDKYKNQLDEENFLDLIKILCTDSISTGNEPKIPLNDNDDFDLKDWLLSKVDGMELRDRLSLAKKFNNDQDGTDDLNNYEPQQKKNYPTFDLADDDSEMKANENYNLNEKFKEINKNLDEVEQYAKVNSDKNLIDKKLDQKKPGPFIIDDSDSKYDKRFDESRIKDEMNYIFNGLKLNRDESINIPINEKRFANNEFKFDNPTPINEDHKPVEEGAVHIELDKDNKNLKLVEPTAPGEKSQFAAIDSSYAFIYFKKSKKSILNENDNQMSNIQQPYTLKDDETIRFDFLKGLEKKLGLQTGVFSNIDYNDVGKDNLPDCVPFSFLNYVIKFDNDEKSCNCKLLAVTFRVNPNSKDLNATAVADSIGQYQDLQSETGLVVIQTGIGDKVKVERKLNCNINLLQTFINLSLLAMASILVVTLFIFYQRKDYLRQKIDNAVYGAPVLGRWFGSEKDYTQCNLASKPQKLSKADLEKQALDYQDLCRQRMKDKAHEQNKKSNKEKVDDTTKLIYQAGNNQAQSLEKCKTQQQSTVANDALINTAMNMDISTGHLILEYMENHLKQNGDKLNREWNALSNDEFESTQNAAKLAKNKNRYPDDPSTWPFDNSRVLLNDLESKDHIDYINASTIIDSDPNPIYIATQGPMKDTISDFWEMCWSSSSSVIVMLTRLVENGVEQSARYWPEKGSERYLHYEVNLVSEHIWSEQYLVRSLYLKNLLKNETRTVTQFHFMAWPENSVPNSPATLLEFRRKVNKSYREKSSPIIVHCSDGCNRTGAYCLIDLILNRLTKGVKEIDLAATLEHLRDQRPGMIKDQQKFEFCLKAIAEEVHNLLRSLQQK